MAAVALGLHVSFAAPLTYKKNDALRAAERRHNDRKDGLVASTAILEGVLAQAGMSYHEWVWTL